LPGVLRHPMGVPASDLVLVWFVAGQTVGGAPRCGAGLGCAPLAAGVHGALSECGVSQGRAMVEMGGVEPPSPDCRVAPVIPKRKCPDALGAGVSRGVRWCGRSRS